MKFLVGGELNLDLVLQNYLSFPALGQETLVEDVTLTLGSSGAICAAGLAKLGNAVSFTGKLGCDSWGDSCLEFLSKLNVDHSRVLRDSSVKTGITVSISSPKDRAMVTYLGAMAANRAEDIAGAGFEDLDHLHISSIFLQRALRPGLKSLLAKAHAHGLTTSIDPGFDPEEKWGRDVIETLAEVDVFLPNEVELEGITGESDPERALRALENGRTLTVAKLGGRGCAALDGGTLLRVEAFRVQPVDTTGAGDSFNAGFLHAWRRKAPLQDALRFGAACGAISTLGPGGTTTQATVEQALDFTGMTRFDEPWRADRS
jgi:sugar/nucleoside kinase (ribokinase family)